MQKDYTIFRIPNQPQTPANDFVAPSRPEPIRIAGVTYGQISYQPIEQKCPFYDELNSIAEDLEKCRLRNS